MLEALRGRPDRSATQRHGSPRTAPQHPQRGLSDSRELTRARSIACHPEQWRPRRRSNVLRPRPTTHPRAHRCAPQSDLRSRSIRHAGRASPRPAAAGRRRRAMRRPQMKQRHSMLRVRPRDDRRQGRRCATAPRDQRQPLAARPPPPSGRCPPRPQSTAAGAARMDVADLATGRRGACIPAAAGPAAQAPSSYPRASALRARLCRCSQTNSRHRREKTRAVNRIEWTATHPCLEASCIRAG